METVASSSGDEKHDVQSILNYVSEVVSADLSVQEDSKKNYSDESICSLMMNGKRRRRDQSRNSIVNAVTAKVIKKCSHKGSLIGVLLEKNMTLTHLNLSHNRIGEEGCIRIAEGIGKNVKTRLRELDLSYNTVYNEGGQALGQMIRANASLRTLNLTHCGIFVEGSKAIMAAVARNATLQKLHYANNSTWIDGADVCAQMLAVNTSLLYLDVSSNFLYADGTKLIAKGLEVNQALEDLLISSNELDDDGAKYLAHALKTNRTLKVATLVLHDNLMSGKAAKALASALSKNDTLQCLHLCENQIGASGVEALAKVLKKNFGLKKLHLADNDLVASSIKSLTRVLQKGGSVTELNLSHNRLEGIRFNKSLEFLDISYNRIQNEGMSHLVGSLERNFTLKRLLVRKRDHQGSIQSEKEREMKEYLQRNINEDIKEMKIALLMGAHEKYGQESALHKGLQQTKSLADLRPLKHVWEFVWDLGGGEKPAATAPYSIAAFHRSRSKS
eukprot:jgi/Bigna1/87023/estExt_fgenesh1_pg.C_160043